MDHHTLAIVSLVGSSLDVLGALYLAYDLLGGEHGPLRTLSRMVTYGILFAIGYGIGLGPVYGIACGATHGLSLAREYARASRGMLRPGFWYDATASAIRSAGFGIAAAWYFGPVFGLAFAALSTLSQIVAYRFDIRPTREYAPGPRPRVTRWQLLSALNRTVGYGVVAWTLCRFLAHRPDIALSFALRFGLTMGIVTAIFGSLTPVVEWAADHVPERRMGVFGVILILAGFALQSVQYWLSLIDIPVR